MQIKSKLLGDIEAEESQFIYFPDGIPAFENEKKFLLIEMQETTPFFYLQSVINPNLCFILADPFAFLPAYQIELEKEQEKRLQLQDASEANIFVILTIPEDFRKTTANLLAPLIVNRTNRRGLQYVPVRSEYSTKYPIFQNSAALPDAAVGEAR